MKALIKNRSDDGDINESSCDGNHHQKNGNDDGSLNKNPYNESRK